RSIAASSRLRALRLAPRPSCCRKAQRDKSAPLASALINDKYLRSNIRRNAMPPSFIAEVEARARAQVEAPSVCQHDLQRSRNDPCNVPLGAPVVGAVARGKVDQANAYRIADRCTHLRCAAFAGNLCYRFVLPLNHGEWHPFDLHRSLSPTTITAICSSATANGCADALSSCAPELPHRSTTAPGLWSPPKRGQGSRLHQDSLPEKHRHAPQPRDNVPAASGMKPREILGRCSRGLRRKDMLLATQWRAIRETSAPDCTVPHHQPLVLCLRIAGSTAPTLARRDRNGNAPPASPRSIAAARRARHAPTAAMADRTKSIPRSKAVAARDCRRNTAARYRDLCAWARRHLPSPDP